MRFMSIPFCEWTGDRCPGRRSWFLERRRGWGVSLVWCKTGVSSGPCGYVGRGDSLQCENAGRTGVHAGESHRPHAFSAYTKSLDVFDLMLARMMGATGCMIA